ncbi:TPA: glycosyltransferase, partial [Vibrio cholerae]
PFDIDHIKKKALEKTNFQVERKYICHVGRISKEKRHTDLIDIYVGSNLFNTHDLVIVGDGPDKDDIIRYIEAKGVMDKVHLIGRVENPYPYIKNASALILCSSYEGFGNVLVEACILNVPVISSNCNFGPKEIVTDEYLFRVGDIDNAKIKIETAVSLGKPTNRIPLEAFSQNNICHQYLNIIEN